jgi:hypothetical protein
LLLVTFLIYSKSLHYEFLSWDDDKQITDNSLIKKYPTAIPRLYVTPCPKDCIHDGKTSCPVKIANDANRKKIDNIQNLKQN